MKKKKHSFFSSGGKKTSVIVSCTKTSRKRMNERLNNKDEAKKEKKKKWRIKTRSNMWTIHNSSSFCCSCLLWVVIWVVSIMHIKQFLMFCFHLIINSFQCNGLFVPKRNENKKEKCSYFSQNENLVYSDGWARVFVTVFVVVFVRVCVRIFSFSIGSIDRNERKFLFKFIVCYCSLFVYFSARSRLVTSERERERKVDRSWIRFQILRINTLKSFSVKTKVSELTCTLSINERFCFLLLFFFFWKEIEIVSVRLLAKIIQIYWC